MPAHTSVLPVFCRLRQKQISSMLDLKKLSLTIKIAM